MASIKKPVDYDSPVWEGDSCTHQVYDFPSHATEVLIPLRPMSELVST